MAASQIASNIVVVGGGLVGSAMVTALAASPVLRRKAVTITLLDSLPKKDPPTAKPFSNRVLALNPKSQELLASLGIWSLMTRSVQPVKEMRIWESQSNASIRFATSANHPTDSLNYIVENDAILEAMNKRIEALTGDLLHIRYGTKIKECLLPKDEGVPSKLVLEDGSEILADVVIGADGMNSLVRKSMGTRIISKNYDQCGLVATLEFETEVGDLANVAWQKFLPTGPVALLPLSSKFTSLVWTLPTGLAKEYVKIHENEFLRLLNTKLGDRREESSFVNTLNDFFAMGSKSRFETPKPLVGVYGRAIFPLGFTHSVRYVAKGGVALVGDAAHRVHPLAGLGANLGFSDVELLASKLEDSVADGVKLGDYSYLCEYESERQRGNAPVMLATDVIQGLYCNNSALPVLPRGIGMTLVDNCSFLKDVLRSRAAFT